MKLSELVRDELELEYDQQIAAMLADDQLMQRLAQCKSRDAIETMLADRIAEIRAALARRALDLAKQVI